MWRLFKRKEKFGSEAEKIKREANPPTGGAAPVKPEKRQPVKDEAPAVPLPAAEEKSPVSFEQAGRVFVRPLSSEKIAYGSSFDTYAFKVKRDVNKVEINKAFVAMHKVHPLSIRTMLVPAKEKRRGRIVGVRPSWKKALIRVPKGAKIDVFSGV